MQTQDEGRVEVAAVQILKLKQLPPTWQFDEQGRVIDIIENIPISLQ